MMSMRFTGLMFAVLGLPIFSLLLQQHSIVAYALHADVEMNMMTKAEVAAFGWNTAFASGDQEERDGIRPTVDAGGRKEKQIGGRKLMMTMVVDHHEISQNKKMKEAAGQVQNISPEVSEISGRSKSSVPILNKPLGKWPSNRIHDQQKKSNILEKKAFSSAAMKKKFVKSTTGIQDDHSSLMKKPDQVISRCGSWKCSWRLRSKSTSSSEGADLQKIYRSRKLLEDSHYKIVNLIHKDYYKGMGNPRRKPPINNNEPLEDDAEP